MTMRLVLRLCVTAWVGFCLLAGCREEGHAQQGHAMAEKAAEISLEGRCKELSEKSEYEYEVLSGTAIVVEKSFSALDCLTEDCRLNLPATFFAYMEAEGGEKLRIVTPTETFRTLYPKPLYMEKGKSYMFCARRITEVRGNPGHNDREYKIDFLDTIHLLQEQE